MHQFLRGILHISSEPCELLILNQNNTRSVLGYGISELSRTRSEPRSMNYQDPGSVPDQCQISTQKTPFKHHSA